MINRLCKIGFVTLAAVVAMTASASQVRADDIVDIAAGNKKFSTLVAAVKAAGLVETLKGDGPFTVFAPTDEAFKKLPKGTVETLLKPENKDKLVAILTYHVVPGKVMAADVAKLKNGAKVETVNGAKATVTFKNKSIFIDKAKITATDIVADNGVIHVIDQVILPKEMSKPAKQKAQGDGASCSGSKSY